MSFYQVTDEIKQVRTTGPPKTYYTWEGTTGSVIEGIIQRSGYKPITDAKRKQLLRISTEVKDHPA